MLRHVALDTALCGYKDVHAELRVGALGQVECSDAILALTETVKIPLLSITWSSVTLFNGIPSIE